MVKLVKSVNTYDDKLMTQRIISKEQMLIEKARERVIRAAKKWEADMDTNEYSDTSTFQLSRAIKALNRLETIRNRQRKNS